MAQPIRERPANGVVQAGVDEALAALAMRPTQDPVTGRFVAGGLAAGKTLERSEAFWAGVETVKRELAEAVRANLAASDAAETMRGLIDGYSEVRLFRVAMFRRLVDLGGPVTTKGKARNLYGAYLQALDRETKLAQIIGLERRAKQVPQLADVLREAAE